MYHGESNLSNAFDSIDIKSKDEKARKKQKKYMGQQPSYMEEDDFRPRNNSRTRQPSIGRMPNQYDRPRKRSDESYGNYLHPPVKGSRPTEDSYIDMSALLNSENEKVSRFSMLNESRDSMAKPKQRF